MSNQNLEITETLEGYPRKKMYSCRVFHQELKQFVVYKALEKSQLIENVTLDNKGATFKQG